MIDKVCGICGLFNLDNAIRLGVSVLINQENRGTDSSGVAYITKRNKLKIQKKALEPKEFAKVVKYDKGIRNLICHNRNATTNVSEKDMDKEAHPFLSGSKEFAIVHNGHITFHEPLRDFLELLGHTFSSGGVDSEVLVHVLEELLQRYDRNTAMKRFFFMLDGENVLVLFKDNELYGYPANFYFKVAIIDDGIAITSSFDGLKNILEAAEGDVSGYYPDALESNQMLKAVIVDNKVSLSLFGKWHKDIFKQDDFVAHNRIMCDYCKTLKVTERFNDHDRCLECHDAGKTDTSSERHFSNYNQSHITRSLTNTVITTLKNVWGKCEICNHYMTLERLTFCHECNKVLCLDCNNKDAVHSCHKPVYIN